MIDWVLDPTAANAVWESVNHTKVNSVGVETSVRLNLEQLMGWRQSSFSVAYNYIDQSKRETPLLTQSKLEYLRHEPYHTYDVVDTRLAWNANQYSVYAELNNLFGSHSIDYGNVPQPGTWFIAGLTLTY